MGAEFDKELADLWGWLVEGPEEEGYIPHSISLPLLVRIQSPRCHCLLGILVDYSGPAWWFLDTVKCHWGENSLSYVILDGLPVLRFRNCTYLNNHPAEYAKTCAHRQLSRHIYSDISPSEFDLQLVMKQGGHKNDNNPPASWTLTHIFNFLKSYPIDLIRFLTDSLWSCLSHYGLRCSHHCVAVE